MGETLGRDETWSKFEEAKLDELREEGETRTGFLLRFTLTHPNIHTTIVGTKNPEHLSENLRAARRGLLARDVYDEAKGRLERAGVAAAPVS